MERQAEHTVGFRRLAFEYILPLFGDEVPLRDHHGVSRDQHQARIQHLEPIAILRECVDAAANRNRQQHHGDDGALACAEVRDCQRNEQREQQHQSKFKFLRPFRTDQIRARQDVVDDVGVNLYTGEKVSYRRDIKVTTAGRHHADENDLVPEDIHRDFLVTNVREEEARNRFPVQVVDEETSLRHPPGCARGPERFPCQARSGSRPIPGCNRRESPVVRTTASACH